MTEVVGAFPPYVWRGKVEMLPTPDNTTTDGRIRWLELRRTGVGSSDCSTVLGMGRATPHALWLDKTGRMPFDLSDNEAMFWGRKMEPTIREVTAERLGVDYYCPPMLRSIEFPWMLSSLDGVFIEPEEDTMTTGPAVDEFGRLHVPFEAKNQTEWLRADWSDDQIPDHAELQVHHSMIVTGAPYGYVAGLLGGNRLVVRRIDADPELHAHIIAEERRFWHDHVLTDAPPPITHRDSPDTILGAAADTDVDTLTLDNEQAITARQLIDQYADGALLERRGQEMKREAANNLLAMAGWHELLVDETGEPIVRLQRGQFAKSRFADEHPDIADVSMKKIEVLDTDAIKAEHPDLYRRFQSRSVRKPTKKDLATAARRKETH